MGEPVQDGPALEVAARRHAVERHDLVGQVGVAVQGGDHLVGRPDVEQPLLALAVGVLGRREPAAGLAQVAQHVADRLVQDLEIPVEAGDLPGVQVDAGEQRLVVQHLLEVGDEPRLVHRVPGEPAAQVVVDAARGHGVEGRLDDLPHRGVVDLGASGGGSGGGQGSDQDVQAHGLRELRGRAEAAVGGVVHPPEVAERALEGVDARHLLARLEQRGATERAGELAGLRLHVVAPRAPQRVDAAAQVGERDHPARAALREVRAAEERAAVGRQEHGHRPAAVAAHGLDGLHVDLVDVGPLLAVDLDVDEQVVHEGRDLVVLERLVRHDVAPVARRVADREQDRPVALLGRRERLVAPRVPVDRVVGVLAEVGAGLVGEPIGAAVHGAQPTAVPRGPAGVEPA